MSLDAGFETEAQRKLFASVPRTSVAQVLESQSATLGAAGHAQGHDGA
jgi:hypothetical protein